MKNNTDLGTLFNVEMYYNYDYNLKGKECNSNTFRQNPLSVNDSAPTALAIDSQAFQAISEKDLGEKDVSGFLGCNGSTIDNQRISNKPGFVRLNPNVKYSRISVQLSNYREGTRNKRANIYLSLMESTMNKFNVFLTGSLTNNKHELYRGCKNSETVKNIIDALFENYKDIMVARLRYKPVNGYITDFHKSNTKSAIVGVYKNSDNEYVCVLVLYYEFIEIVLDMPMTDKQKQCYIAHGLLEDINELNDLE